MKKITAWLMTFLFMLIAVVLPGCASLDEPSEPGVIIIEGDDTSLMRDSDITESQSVSGVSESDVIIIEGGDTTPTGERDITERQSESEPFDDSSEVTETNPSSILLTDLEYTQKENVAINDCGGWTASTIDTSTYNRDMDEKVYDSTLQPDAAEGTINYDLDSKYKRLTGTVYRPYCSISGNGSNGNSYKDGIIKIYGDGKLLYESPRITQATYETYSFILDVSSVRELMIYIAGVFYPGWGLIPTVGLADGTLWESEEPFDLSTEEPRIVSYVLLTDLDETRNEGIAINYCGGWTTNSIDTSTYNQDTDETVYYSTLQPNNAEGTINYYLNYKYKRLTGIVYRPYCSLSGNGMDLNSYKEGVVQIYGDGNLIYESPKVTQQTYETYSFNVDVSSIRELKINITGVFYPGGGFLPTVGLADGKLWETDEPDGWTFE